MRQWSFPVDRPGRVLRRHPDQRCPAPGDLAGADGGVPAREDHEADLQRRRPGDVRDELRVLAVSGLLVELADERAFGAVRDPDQGPLGLAVSVGKDGEEAYAAGVQAFQSELIAGLVRSALDDERESVITDVRRQFGGVPLRFGMRTRKLFLEPHRMARPVMDRAHFGRAATGAAAVFEIGSSPGNDEIGVSAADRRQAPGGATAAA